MDVVRDFFLTDRFLLWKNAAAVLGAACVAVFVLKQLRLLHGAFHAYVMTPLTRKNLKKYGSWAGKLRVPLTGYIISSYNYLSAPCATAH